MPTIKNFGSFKITMYFLDHGTPHAHVIGPGFQAKIAIEDSRLIIGEAPARVLKQAQDWVAENRKELNRKWKKVSE